jgi:hypothetical protein
VENDARATRKKVFVAIGLPKTGTTAIQFFLHYNMERLLEQGVLYANAGRHPRAIQQHGLLAEAFLPAPLQAGDFTLTEAIDRNAVMSELVAEIKASAASRIIISSESLCMIPADRVEEFGQWLADFDIVPIVYLRNFADIVDAAYQTHIMHNVTTAAFGDMGYQFLLNADLVANCQTWSKIAYNKKIVVRDYDDPEDSNSILSFSRIVELDLTKLPPAERMPRLNASLSPTLVVLKSEMLRAGVPLERVNRLLTFLGRLQFERQTVVPQQFRTQLLERYDSQLQHLAASEFVDGLDAIRQGSPRRPPPEKIEIPNLIEAIFSIGRAVYRSQTPP